jgi:Antitoxin ParD
MTRLTIEITDQRHQSIKAMAALNGQTIKEYSLKRLFSESSETDNAMNELKAFLQERILAAGHGVFSTMDINAIMEDELQKGLDA